MPGHAVRAFAVIRHTGIGAAYPMVTGSAGLLMLVHGARLRARGRAIKAEGVPVE
jgi:hypothetical protein